MAYDPKAVLDQLETLVSGLASMQDVQIGVPGSLSNQVSAYVTLGGLNPKDKAAGLRSLWQNFLITFGYRTDGNVSTAERTLADLLKELEQALFDDRTLAGTVESLEADFSGADDPQYVPIAGQEFRRYPVLVRVKQSRNYP
ncbi:MAG: hypothetical protein C4551_10090 [Bacillota bacterium]|jgi:hypothetical protein|nr:MAG: hypothetical protein C4551_10090 [Bacillota bacterium]